MRSVILGISVATLLMTTPVANAGVKIILEGTEYQEDEVGMHLLVQSKVVAHVPLDKSNCAATQLVYPVHVGLLVRPYASTKDPADRAERIVSFIVTDGPSLKPGDKIDINESSNSPCVGNGTILVSTSGVVVE